MHCMVKESDIMFSKILIANRGEIAVRIIRACKEMGIETVAIYSTADKGELHVNMADESYCIGGVSLQESYLNMDSIIMLAKNVGASAIHPGYGLLSENYEFAKKCEEAGIVFIGPDYHIIRQMGLKEEARALAKSAGVPILEGSDILKDEIEVTMWAKKIGYPVILKARAGGGGKGIRIVYSDNELLRAYGEVKAEALNAFGDDAIFMEKFLENTRHIEVQIIGDKYGNVVTLLDRDCSVQKNNQKLIEECPASKISNELEDKLVTCAKSLAKYVNYTSVGTVEFLVSNEDYYFLEMNTRLQVEHSVSEMVTGIDIVKWQIRVSAGVELSFGQEDVKMLGHAIECRICSVSGAGKVELLHVPGGMNVRFDSALFQDSKISPFYDSMLGKLVVSAPSRGEAIRKMKAALSELVLVGVPNNRDIHMRFMNDNRFIEGDYTTKIYQEVMKNNEF